MKKVLVAIISALISLPVLADVTGVVSPPGGSASSLPSQTGNSGKFLTTDGSAASWASPTASASSVTPGTTTVVGATAPCFLENSTSTTMACPGTLPAALMPALSGDLSGTAGSLSVTVSKVNGASVPLSASLLSTNASGQLTATSNAPTATALATAPLQCSAGQFSTGITTTGDANCGTPAGSGTVGSGTAGQLAQYAVNGSTVSGLSVATNNLVGSTGSGAAALTPAQAIGVLNSATANIQTVTSYPLASTDVNGEVTMNNAAANTVCLPSGLTTMLGSLVTIQQVGAGVTTLAPAGASGCTGTGVTITSGAYGSSTTQTYSLGGTYGFIQLQQTATNTWNVVAWDTPANQKLAALSSEMQAYLSASTQFTYSATGCTPSAAVGGPFAGKITLAATCTQIVVTLNGATGFTDTNGYTCTMADDTLQAAGTWFGTWPANSTTSTTATFAIPPAAGATDTVSFACHPRSL